MMMRELRSWYDMKTKYGDIPNEMIVNYKQRLIDKVFKILPMKEEGWDTWNLYMKLYYMSL